MSSKGASRIRSRVPADQTQDDTPETDEHDQSEDTGESGDASEEESEEEKPSRGIRSRTAATPRASSVGDNKSNDDNDDWMKTGREAQKLQQIELEKNKEKERRRAEGIFMPYRFWLPAAKQVEIVLLDDEPGPSFYEHQLQDPQSGKWDIYEGCPKEFEACPLCDGQAGGKESYYVQMFTAMVLDPYINKNGQTVEHSRKLLAVKTNDQPFFMRTFEREGTLRGVHLLMARESKRDSNIGRPEFIQRHSEADIMTSFGHPEIKTNDGRVIKKANADCFAFPYSKLWTRPSGDDLRRRYGGAPPMGSAGDISGGKKIGSGSLAEDLDDDVPF